MHHTCGPLLKSRYSGARAVLETPALIAVPRVEEPIELGTTKTLGRGHRSRVACTAMTRGRLPNPETAASTTYPS